MGEAGKAGEAGEETSQQGSRKSTERHSLKPTAPLARVLLAVSTSCIADMAAVYAATPVTYIR